VSDLLSQKPIELSQGSICDEIFLAVDGRSSTVEGHEVCTDVVCLNSFMEGAQMTFGRASVLALGVLCGLAMGILGGTVVGLKLGQRTIDRASSEIQVPATRNEPRSVAAGQNRRVAAARRAIPRTAKAVIPVSAPELQKHLKPLLNNGSDMSLAARDFRDAEQFAAVAHAARNTNVPFVLLKHRVLNEGKTLAEAIRESKPDLNALAEANRARTEAKSDIMALASTT
jgi:hypothetical protein